MFNDPEVILNHILNNLSIHRYRFNNRECSQLLEVYVCVVVNFHKSKPIVCWSFGAPRLRMFDKDIGIFSTTLKATLHLLLFYLYRGTCDNVDRGGWIFIGRKSSIENLNYFVFHKS